MRILLVNDDGVHAPGILALSQVMMDMGDVRMVAPSEERSTTGHGLNLNWPLRLIPLPEKNHFAVTGLPADCTLMGFQVFGHERPELVLSGINRGGNLGQDIYYSGTVAAAREASFHGLPAIAFSLVMEFSGLSPILADYLPYAEWIKQLIHKGIHKHIPKHSLLNINFPFLPFDQIKGARLTQLGFRQYSESVQVQKDPRGKDYYWIIGKYNGFQSIPESDTLAIDEGFISMTLLSHVPLECLNEDEKAKKGRLEEFIQGLF